LIVIFLALRTLLQEAAAAEKNALQQEIEELKKNLEGEKLID